MKKVLIVTLLLVASICCAASAQATSACFCVGFNRAAGTCGYGAVSGNFMDVRKNLPDNLMKYLLLTQALRDTLAATGKAYDTRSGWACWKE